MNPEAAYTKLITCVNHKQIKSQSLAYHSFLLIKRGLAMRKLMLKTLNWKNRNILLIKPKTAIFP